MPVKIKQRWMTHAGATPYASSPGDRSYIVHARRTTGTPCSVTRRQLELDGERRRTMICDGFEDKWRNLGKGTEDFAIRSPFETA